MGNIIAHRNLFIVTIIREGFHRHLERQNREKEKSLVLILELTLISHLPQRTLIKQNHFRSHYRVIISLILTLVDESSFHYIYIFETTFPFPNAPFCFQEE